MEDVSRFTKPTRIPLKSVSNFNNDSNWRQKLKENCFKRLREDRSRLLWKTRMSTTSSAQSTDHKGFIESAFRDIVSDELKKINSSSSIKKSEISPSVPEVDDMLWEYDGVHNAYQGDCEEILIEMQRIFYEEQAQSTSNEAIWEDEEDEYLARAVYEHMQLNEEQVRKKVWCPICKHGELQEKNQLIYCTLCKLQLNKDNEVNLGILRDRLAELHTEHFNRGCRLKPNFRLENKFGLNALYMFCEGCCSFEVVI
ncbi:uncharacterized protein [Rutidosis leptorrhynchoides]|uniref:uncharacterized protein n=1 Tax=Rutidosis leptorrhynchoides TaxID=125765 RepID=UPI003A9936D6